MAIIDIQRVDVPAAGRPIFKWETLTATDTGAPLYLPSGGAQVAVQATGTFGGTVSIEGTVDEATWFALDDILGEPIALTAAGYAEISTAVVAIRPSAGAGVTDVDAFVSVVA